MALLRRQKVTRWRGGRTHSSGSAETMCFDGELAERMHDAKL